MKNITLTIIITLGLLLNLNAELLDSKRIVQDAQSKLTIIDTYQLVKLLKDKPNTKIIDVRERADILKDGGFIKANKVTNIPRGKLEFMIGEIVNFDETFVVHCFNGNQSALAAKRLQDIGYKNVLYYKDSFQGWQKAKLPISSLDRYQNSMLYDKVKKVSDGVYTSIGHTNPLTYENSGHNNNLGFIIGSKGIVVWNASSNYLLAKALHEEIKKISDKPILYVVLENSQGHAMLGSNYWKEQGVKIISHKIAKEEIMQKGEKIYKSYAKRLKDKILSTKVVIPDITFEKSYTIDLGDRKVEAKYFGYAHEHSDIGLWLEKEKIFFAGDLAFNERLLPIFEITETKKWLKAWEGVEALNAKIVIPGHGDVTDMNTVRKYTKDYLVYLREKIIEILDNDGGLNDAYNIDMSAYEHLDTFKELGRQNIARLFKQMEFED